MEFIIADSGGSIIDEYTAHGRVLVLKLTQLDRDAIANMPENAEYFAMWDIASITLEEIRELLDRLKARPDGILRPSSTTG